MSRRILALAAVAAAVALGVWGCQDYNFNPVGSCVIQPGQRQVTLADVTTADILFLIDDSASTDSKQQGLAKSFSSFIASLAAGQADRASKGLQPFDFHIAVATSSIFWTQATVAGYDMYTKYLNPLPTTQCTPGVAVAGADLPNGNFVAGTLAGSTTPNPKVLHFTKDLTWANCSTGGACSQACIAGGGTCTPGCTTSPTTGVTTCTDSRLTTLIQQFVGIYTPTATNPWAGGNVEVGSCGSGEEQHLQGARLAMQKALAGQQPGVAAADWPHPGAKLVIVWVGDEDDCSSPATNPVVMQAWQPGNDSCVQDKYSATPKEFPVAEFDAYFSSLVAPPGQPPTAASPYASLGAAFIVSATRCSDGVSYAPADSCSTTTPIVPNVCPTLPPVSCQNPPQPACGVAYAAGVRFFQLADAFKARSFDVIEGTVCDVANPAGFGPTLAAIADLVKAPTSLKLPSVPAASDITILRIADASGRTVKTCTQRTTPGPVASPSTAEGWWFIACSDSGAPPAVASAPTLCVYINHAAAATSNSCEAQPGQTYSAEYLGRIPAAGCASPTSTACAADPTCTAAGATCRAGQGVCDGAGQCCGSLSCAQALPAAGGGSSRAIDWWCYAPAGQTTGSCVCRTP